MKKILSLAISMVMVASLAACGTKKSDNVVSTKEAAKEVATTTAGNATKAAEKGYKDPSTVKGKVMVYTTMDEGQMKVVEAIFNKHYPDCQIEWLSDSIGTLMTKIQSEASSPQADAVVGGLFQSDDSRYYSLLEKYKPSNVDEQAIQDPNNYYAYQDVQYMCLIVNTDLEKKLGVKIESYKDLLDPKVKGKVYLADPASTSSGFRQYTTILQLMSKDHFGDKQAWDYLTKLTANSVSTTSSSQVYKAVMDGEYVAGLSYESIVLDQLKNGAKNIRIVYPKEGNTACANGSAVVKGAPNRAAAEAIVDLMLTAEVQNARAEQNCCRGTRKDFAFDGFESAEKVGIKELDFDLLREQKDKLLDQWATKWEEFGGKK